MPDPKLNMTEEELIAVLDSLKAKGLIDIYSDEDGEVRVGLTEEGFDVARNNSKEN